MSIHIGVPKGENAKVEGYKPPKHTFGPVLAEQLANTQRRLEAALAAESIAGRRKNTSLLAEQDHLEHRAAQLEAKTSSALVGEDVGPALAELGEVRRRLEQLATELRSADELARDRLALEIRCRVLRQIQTGAAPAKLSDEDLADELAFLPQFAAYLDAETTLEASWTGDGTRTRGPGRYRGNKAARSELVAARERLQVVQTERNHRRFKRDFPAVAERWECFENDRRKFRAALRQLTPEALRLNTEHEALLELTRQLKSCANGSGGKISWRTDPLDDGFIHQFTLDGDTL